LGVGEGNSAYQLGIKLGQTGLAVIVEDQYCVDHRCCVLMSISVGASLVSVSDQPLRRLRDDGQRGGGYELGPLNKLSRCLPVPELLYSFTHHPKTMTTAIITMASKSITRMGSTSLRRCFRAPIASQVTAKSFIPRACVAATTQRRVEAVRSFHSSLAAQGIMPDAENPKPKQSEDIEDPKVPTEISTNEYHRLADEYLEDLVTKLEGEAEKNPKMEVEYSVHTHFILTYPHSLMVVYNS
jgi:hypothetical protein